MIAGALSSPQAWSAVAVVVAATLLLRPQKEPFRGDKQLFIDDLEQALYASKIISYTQGFMLMRETAKEVDHCYHPRHQNH